MQGPSAQDAVHFEVVEFNGRCEAVKLLLPTMLEDPDEAPLRGVPRPKTSFLRGCCGACLYTHTYIFCILMICFIF